MPVQINELVIRAVVEGQPPRRPADGRQPREREQLVEQCVEQVLEILENRQER